MAKTALLFLLSAACVQAPTAVDQTTTAGPAETSTSTTLAPPTTGPPEPFVYRVGLTEPPTTDNYWEFFDPQSSLADQYLLGSTKPSLYTFDPPGFALANYLAADGDVPAPVEADDGWEVVVDMVPDAVWSDGAAITADDVVFTFETVRDLGLGRGWLSVYPVVEADSPNLGLISVEATDVDTVRFLYNGRPGLAFWPNGPGTAPIMPRHHWEPITSAALGQDDPAAALLIASGVGDPSGGPIILDGTDPTDLSAVPNPNWVRSGETVESGSVSYDLGPFFEAMSFDVFDGQPAAAQALVDDQIDVILTATGLDPRLADRLVAEPDIDVIRNQINGFRYVAFNLRRRPMAVPAFRNALELMNDRDGIVDDVFGDQATAAIASIPSANGQWFNPEAVQQLRDGVADLTPEQRLSRAVDALAGGGFTWEREPRFADNGVEAGSGAALDGELVRPLQILAPAPEFDPLRSTYALWLQRWLTDLGFTVEVHMTDFASIVRQVFTPAKGNDDIDFDMVVLGWRLPSSSLPVHHGSFWASTNDTLVNDGNNNTGFSDARFDAFVQEYNAATNVEEAYQIVWEMERVLYETKPYLILFDTAILEAYRSDRVEYPFTEVLSGIQAAAGLPGAVQETGP